MTEQNKQADHTNHILHAIVDFIGTSRTQVIVYTTLCFLLLISSRLTILLEKMGVDETTKTNLSDLWFDNISSKIEIFDNISSTAGTAVLWFAVGGIVYLLGWALTVTIIDSYNDVVISTRFMHSRSFHQSDFWIAKVGRNLIRLSVFFILFRYALWVIYFFIPYSYRTFTSLWSFEDPVRDVFRLILTFSIVLLVQHILIILARLTFLRRRLS